MKTTNTLAALLTILAAFNVFAAQEPEIIFKGSAHKTAPTVILRSLYDFEQSLSLKVKTNPLLNADEVLIRRIEQFNMLDARGVRIHGHLDIDAANNIVIGFSGGSAEIIASRATQNGVQITGSFKAKDGSFISPPLDQIVAYDLNGNKLCAFENLQQQTTKPMHFVLMLDRSWSMKKVITDVKQSAQDFLNLLPQGALCGVAQFGDDWSYSHRDFLACSNTDFGIEEIKLSGTTDIYPLLKATYAQLSKPLFHDHQKTIIIITDGYTLSDEAKRQELIALKGDVLTLTYFIGGAQRNALEGITDHFAIHEGNIRQTLGSYFKTLSHGYNAQKMLTIKPCGGGQ